MYKIALDGPPGSGKSTLAKKIADNMNIEYLDSGAIYRAFTLHCILSEVDEQNDSQILLALDNFSLNINEKMLKINGVNYTDEIRKPYISTNIWKIADNKFVREYIVNFCRAYAKEKSVVMDGRDIATAVFPETPYKFYVTANIDVRTERRFNEMQKKGEKIELDRVKEMIIERENSEKNRLISPLSKHPDAIEIDTSYKNVEELAQEVISNINNIDGGLE